MYHGVQPSYDEEMRNAMTPEQWTTILSQLGVGGVAILVIVKVIVPMFLEKARELVGSAAAHTAALERNTAAVSQLAERMARVESMLEHGSVTEPGPYRERPLVPVEGGRR